MDEPAPLVLTIDDDPHLLALIENKVSGWGYDHRGAIDTNQMYKQLEKISPSVILLDVALGRTDGTTLLPQLKQQLPNVPVIMITAHATIETAVKSLKSGAYDFVCKPLDFDRLHIEIDKAVRQNRLSLQVRAFQSAARRTDFHGMIGRSEPMRKAYRLIEAVAPTDATVLLLGQVDELDRIDLKKTFTAGDLLNLLRARTYGDRSFAYFSEAGQEFEVGVFLKKRAPKGKHAAA